MTLARLPLLLALLAGVPSFQPGYIEIKSSGWFVCLGTSQLLAADKGLFLALRLSSKASGSEACLIRGHGGSRGCGLGPPLKNEPCFLSLVIFQHGSMYCS